MVYKKEDDLLWYQGSDVLILRVTILNKQLIMQNVCFYFYQKGGKRKTDVLKSLKARTQSSIYG